MVQKKEYAKLYKELEVHENNGVHISIDGMQASAFQIVQAHMIRETGSYMRDYGRKPCGEIEEIMFDRIK